MKKIIIWLFEIISKMFKKEEKSIVQNKPSNSVLKEYLTPIKILIDNGHGIDTIGKRSPYSANRVEPSISFFEWEWNREIAFLIFEELLTLGYDVELLVPENEDISLKARVERINKICEEYGSDKTLLISIHSNACGNGTSWMTAQGWEAYTSIGDDKSDVLSSIFYEEAKNIFTDRKIRYDWTDGDADREADFYIIKNSLCPAILTENFFYDNIDDIKYILSEEGKNKIVELHVKAIIKYLMKK